MKDHSPLSRIRYLDGLRGIAILLVIFFHAYVRWPDIVPYGSRYAEVIFLKDGWLGVELFFMISGFVIFMTLEKCPSLSYFLKKRWLRLFPAMLIISLLVFFTARFFPERPAGIPAFQDVLPGLLFISPHFFSAVLAYPFNHMEASFWSLYVEVKFYILFGSLYFWLGEKKAKIGLGIAWSISVCGNLAHMLFHTHTTDIFTRVVDKAFSWNYFGWFIVGIIAYDIQKKRGLRELLAATGIALVSSLLLVPVSSSTFVFLLLLIALFIGPLYSRVLQEALQSKLLVFVGFISYPLYLVHENAMVAMIAKLKQNLPSIPDVLTPIAPIGVLIGLSFLVAKFLEPSFRAAINECGKYILLAKKAFRKTGPQNPDPT